MIAWVDSLLQRWAETLRSEAGGSTGRSPSWLGGAALADTTRARFRRRDALQGCAGPVAGVARAGLSGGVTAHAVGTMSGPRVSVMRGDIEKLDRFLGALPREDYRLLWLFYVDGYLTATEKAGKLGMGSKAMYARLNQLQVQIDRHFRPRAYASADLAMTEAEIDRLIAALS